MLHEHIVATTSVLSPALVPELSLRLATPSSPLWNPSVGFLEQLGTPHPFWAFAWGGGQALARFLLDNPAQVRALRVLCLGCGCGTEAIAAGVAGATRVLATDIDPWALEATKLNAQLNQVSVDVSLLDAAEADFAGWDVILAAEITYDSASTGTLLGTQESLRTAGATMFVADLDRGFLDPERFTKVASYRAPSDIDHDGRYHKTASIYRLG